MRQLLALICGMVLLNGCIAGVLAGATAIGAVLNGVATGYTIQEKRMYIKAMEKQPEQKKATEAEKKPSPQPEPEKEEVQPVMTYL